MDLEQARAVLLDHARRPRNVRAANDSDATRPGTGQGPAEARTADLRTGECRNPICGDLVRVFVRLADGRISDCTLQVHGCTICTASASLMSDLVKNRTVAEVDEIRTLFQTAVGQPAGQEWPAELSDLAALHHLRVNPARIACSLIGWLAITEALRP